MAGWSTTAAASAGRSTGRSTGCPPAEASWSKVQEPPRRTNLTSSVLVCVSSTSGPVPTSWRTTTMTDDRSGRMPDFRPVLNRIRLDTLKRSVNTAFHPFHRLLAGTGGHAAHSTIVPNVWPWLIGPFAEAWVRVRGGTAEARREARSTFLVPLLQHLDQAGFGHISEIADGDPPHTPRGCPFQAWSVGEVLRLAAFVLAENKASPRKIEPGLDPSR